MASAAEFFHAGLFAERLAFSLTRGRGVRTKLVVAGVAAFCLLCSLGDQLYKVFVLGREFGAVGYGAGIALAWPLLLRPFRFASVFSVCFIGLHHRGDGFDAP